MGIVSIVIVSGIHCIMDIAIRERVAVNTAENGRISPALVTYTSHRGTTTPVYRYILYFLFVYYFAQLPHSKKDKIVSFLLVSTY